MIERKAEKGYMFANNDTFASIICVPNETVLSQWTLVTEEYAKQGVAEIEQELRNKEQTELSAE